MLGASPERDAKFRKIAEKLTSEIVHLGSDPAIVEAVAQGEDEVSFTFTEYEIPFSVAILTGSEQTGHPAQFIAEDKTIVLYFLPIDALEVARTRPGRKKLAKWISNYFEERRSSIFHEVIHLLDFLRSDYTGKQMTEEEAFAPDFDMQKYVSHPVEFNAFFQQAMQETLPQLRKGVNFEVFQKTFFKTHVYKRFLSQLTPAYEKRMLSRLWQTWNNLTA